MREGGMPAERQPMNPSTSLEAEEDVLALERMQRATRRCKASMGVLAMIDAS
jgi:hypothetical protein